MKGTVRDIIKTITGKNKEGVYHRHTSNIFYDDEDGIWMYFEEKRTSGKKSIIQRYEGWYPYPSQEETYASDDGFPPGIVAIIGDKQIKMSREHVLRLYKSKLSRSNILFFHIKESTAKYQPDIIITEPKGKVTFVFVTGYKYALSRGRNNYIMELRTMGINVKVIDHVK